MIQHTTHYQYRVMSINKILKVVLVLFMISVYGCSKSKDKYTWEAMDKLKDIRIEQIEKINFGFDTEGGRLTKETESLKEINEIYNLLSQVSIIESTDIAYDDAGMDIYIHKGKDIISFVFENDVIVIDKERYRVDNIKPLRDYLYSLLDD